jgi:hypothetical protein
MSVEISQYTDRIYLDNCSGHRLIEIKYYGTFIADVVPEDVTIIMNKNTICIMDIGNGFDNQVFMNYYGNLSINGVFYYENNYKIPGGVTRYSDEVNRIKSKFDESTSKYEDFNKTNKYIKNVNSLLSYKKFGRTIYLKNNKKYNSTNKSIKKKELNILNRIRSKYVVK